jgi:tetratricopeptide (TPR) repeat protein
VELPRYGFVSAAALAVGLALAPVPAAGQTPAAAPGGAPDKSLASAPAEAALRYHLALEARRAGDLAQAAAYLAAAVALDPEGAVPRLEWASVLLTTGDVAGAEAALAPLAAWWAARPERSDDDGSRYARLRGTLAARGGDEAGSLAWYERAVARAPYDLGLRSELVARYRVRGDEERALVHLSAAAALMPANAEVRVELGRSFLDMARYTEAEAAFTEAAVLDPRMERAWDGLGLARAGRGDVAGAEEAFRYGLQVAPSSATLYEHLGDALLDGGRVDAALTAYRRAAALAPHVPRLAEKGARATGGAPAEEPAEEPAAAPPPRRDAPR